MKRSILLLLSHSCNLSCKYCYVKFKDSRKMSIDTAIDILDREFSNQGDEITNIDLLGGEPLTNFVIIPPICEWIWERKPKMQIFIRTNGTLLTNKMKKWFSSHSDLIGLGLSIDGTPEVNYFNRGVMDVDIDFFKQYWPEIPVKLTVFPQSVDSLFDSLTFLYSRGVNVIGGLAQGVVWDEKACELLNQQMEKITNYYIENQCIPPIEPLFSLAFEHSYVFPDSLHSEKPCWERNIVHTYDCENDLLPCHMFSVIVQGSERRKRILNDLAGIKEEFIDNECMQCPIRWSCTNCMAMNYQHFGDFSTNINKRYSCKAHKITAYWSASLLTLKALNNLIDFSKKEKIEAVRKAIKYLKTFDNE